MAGAPPNSFLNSSYMVPTWFEHKSNIAPDKIPEGRAAHRRHRPCWQMEPAFEIGGTAKVFLAEEVGFV